MRRSLAVAAVSLFLLTGCQKQEDPPVSDLDSVESTLNSVESELDEP